MFRWPATKTSQQQLLGSAARALETIAVIRRNPNKPGNRWRAG